MKKINSKLLVILLCFCLVLSGSACTLFTGSSVVSTEPIKGLKQTYQGSNVNITPLEIKTVESFFLEDEEAVVLIKFEFANSSDEEYNVHSYEVYIDDLAVAVGYWQNVLDGSEKELPSTIAPGKRAEGYWGVNVPINTKNIEFRITVNGYPEEYVTFIFDIPSIEE